MRNLIIGLVFAFSSSGVYCGIEDLTKTLASGSYSVDSNKNHKEDDLPVLNMDSAADEWKINCSKEKIYNKKRCIMFKLNKDVIVSIFDGKKAVYVGSNHYPKTESIIKIDDLQPVYGLEGDTNTPQKVINQMLKGAKAYTRYVEWPYNYNKDSELDLSGFSDKYAEMLELYNSL